MEQKYRIDRIKPKSQRFRWQMPTQSAEAESAYRRRVEDFKKAAELIKLRSSGKVMMQVPLEDDEIGPNMEKRDSCSWHSVFW
jgi:hypothetical protein